MATLQERTKFDNIQNSHHNRIFQIVACDSVTQKSDNFGQLGFKFHAFCRLLCKTTKRHARTWIEVSSIQSTKSVALVQVCVLSSFSPKKIVGVRWLSSILAEAITSLCDVNTNCSSRSSNNNKMYHRQVLMIPIIVLLHSFHHSYHPLYHWN